jgi:hypothetical protein
MQAELTDDQRTRPTESIHSRGMGAQSHTNHPLTHHSIFNVQMKEPPLRQNEIHRSFCNLTLRIEQFRGCSMKLKDEQVLGRDSFEHTNTPSASGQAKVVLSISRWAAVRWARRVRLFRGAARALLAG